MPKWLWPAHPAKPPRLTGSLHTILAEATHDGIIPADPCVHKRGRGRQDPQRPHPTLDMIEAIVEKLSDRYRLNDYYRNKVSDHRYEALVWALPSLASVRDSFRLGAPGHQYPPPHD